MKRVICSAEDANTQARRFRRFYLASSSPRRRDLLQRAGARFDLLPFRSGVRGDAEIEESIRGGEAAENYVLRLARAKAEHGERLLVWRRLPLRPVLSADTALEVDGEIIGKPVSEAHARDILRRLSGREHRVLTAVALVNSGRLETALSISEVCFRTLCAAEIRRYVASGEAMDKAGAYGIQGRAALFIARINGSDTGIMGLPMCETGVLLQRFGYGW
ncbi:MAG: Maf family nucleotide pyrophosphatase [Zoogloeaceae bacterium]|jgi:septum formation protein|nr:Maf family nucleotide pyrophosphatase [Zoogloeaceae bacterium]